MARSCVLFRFGMMQLIFIVTKGFGEGEAILILKTIANCMPSRPKKKTIANCMPSLGRTCAKGPHACSHLYGFTQSRGHILLTKWFVCILRTNDVSKII